MERFLLGILLAIFSGSKPANPPAPVTPPATLVAAQGVAQAAPEPVYSKAPVSAAAARQARAAVKYRKEPGSDNLITHQFVFADGTEVSFPDRPKRPRDAARRERIVFFTGSERASAEPDSTFDAAGRTAGLSPTAIAALRFVSRHEGGFDAINTWDRARFSWGFIQFAGGYGFPPALAHVKASSPDLFQKHFADFGIDVVPGPDGRPQPVYVDAESGKTVRGDDAEQAFGDDPLAIALFIRAGRVTEIKQRQVEAAIRDYAGPALNSTHRNMRLSDVLTSPQGLAMLIDRKVHEGNVARLELALDHAWLFNNPSNPIAGPQMEGLVLDLAVQDADARARVAELVETAASGLERGAGAVRGGQDASATMTAARRVLEQAMYEVDNRMVVSQRREDLHFGLYAALQATDPMRFQMVAAADVARELEGAASRTRDLVARLKSEASIRNRLQDIRTSTLPGPPASPLQLAQNGSR